MRLLKDAPANKTKLLEDDIYLARCYAVVVTGTQFNQLYGKAQTSMRFMFELPSELITFEKDGETVTMPKTISTKPLTYSMHERANLRKFLESWIGRKFTADELRAGVDPNKFCGMPCKLHIAVGTKADGSEYNSIDSIFRLKDGKCPPLYNEKIAFDIGDPEQDLDEMDKLPSWIQDIIRKSDEWQRRMYPEDYATEDASQYDDDIPVEFKDEDIPF